MSGRYVVATPITDLADMFGAAIDDSARDLEPSYNVAPTDRIPIVLERTEDGRRELHGARWGLVPPWTRDLGDKHKRLSARLLINARLETAPASPAYRAAFAKRRCVVPATGYYEWQRLPDGQKQPQFIHATDDSLLAMAGLFEWWEDTRLPDDHPDRWGASASIITTTPTEHFAPIHDRMPALLTHDAIPEWLDRRTTHLHEIAELLRTTTPTVAETIAFHSVGADVGNVRNNHQGLIAPTAD
ncbi:MAG TPA: SOS response-associated peptidase [Jiangellaceae bacterium]